jgi:hypothetical protein
MQGTLGDSTEHGDAATWGYHWGMRAFAICAALVACAAGCGGAGSENGKSDGGGRDASGSGDDGSDDHAASSSSDGAADVNQAPGLDAAEASDAVIDGRADSSSGSPDGGAGALGHPSQTVVGDAIMAALSSYHRNASTGDIWCLPCDGAPVMLAAAAYTGDTSADARLLQQMRELLGNGKDPFGTGGYAANDERNATAMYAIAKRIPRIFGQLSVAEIHKIDLIMEGTLVADIYATADKTNTGGPPRTFDGSTNSNRDWNPNYREGMIGAVLVGTEYFGGQTPTEALLAAYDHAAFTAELQSNGLSNLYFTFDTYQSNPSAGAPSPQAVQQGIAGYSMHGITLGQLLDLYVNLANDTFSATVSCGLNGGSGILVGSVYAGRVVSGCSALPNAGAVGMEKEFDGVDANGARSDASYVRLGLRTNLFNQLVLVVYGDWKDTTASVAAVKQLAFGVTDFFYKAKLGYQDYSHGTDQGLFQCGNSMDCPLNQALWTQVLAPVHGL